MSSAGLVANNWLVLRETPGELWLVNRGTGITRRLEKKERR